MKTKTKIGMGMKPKKTMRKNKTKKIAKKRILPTAKRGDALPFHPMLGALGSLIGGAASVAKALAPLCEVSMEADTYGSDHYPIITTLGAQVCLTSRFRYRISLSKEQLQLYYHNLSTKANSLSSRNREDVLELYDSFVNDVLTEAKDFLPEDKRFPRSIVWRAKRDLPPWWNSECSDVIGGRREAVRLFVSCPTPGNYAEFCRVCRECSRKLQEQKRTGWREFVGKFNSKTLSRQIWGLIKSFKGRAAAISSNIDSQDLRRVSSEMINKLCPASAYLDRARSVEEMRVDDGSFTNLCPWLDDPLTRKEFRCALATVRKRSAPGLDQVSFEMLSQLPMEYDNLLLESYLLYLHLCAVWSPASWVGEAESGVAGGGCLLLQRQGLSFLKDNPVLDLSGHVMTTWLLWSPRLGQ
ncbi:PREDICTED: uncharacterized protein LOC108759552, partial [Trachymyrmex cornetzi]|uniref:uncharacterized protein LOC108759552 n=1 Tax=Trachymyrmex cornetzi TaxID=471704 RepID=UPI00084F510C